LLIALLLDAGRAGFRIRLCGPFGVSLVTDAFPAVGTPTPEDHLGLFDLVAPIVVCVEARCGADGTFDVDSGAALAADQMMVVVTHPVFVPGCGTRRLDTSKQTFVDEHTERVVDGLSRDRSDL
jgi:hypothetical protein